MENPYDEGQGWGGVPSRLRKAASLPVRLTMATQTGAPPAASDSSRSSTSITARNGMALFMGTFPWLVFHVLDQVPYLKDGHIVQLGEGHDLGEPGHRAVGIGFHLRILTLGSIKPYPLTQAYGKSYYKFRYAAPEWFSQISSIRDSQQTSLSLNG